MTTTDTLVSRARREFLRSIVAGLAVLAAALAGLLPPMRRWIKKLRPPGALSGSDFFSACIKCGQCVQVCPVQALKLADINDGAGNGTPYLEPRLQACDFSCDVLQCILACPTGALHLEPQKKEDVRIGRARFLRPEQCLARQGKGIRGSARGGAFSGLLRYTEIDRWNPILVANHPYELEQCDLCVRQCPVKGAITMHPLTQDPHDLRREPEIHDTCTGCGVCEMICPAEPSCIEIIPLHQTEGTII